MGFPFLGGGHTPLLKGAWDLTPGAFYLGRGQGFQRGGFAGVFRKRIRGKKKNRLKVMGPKLGFYLGLYE